MGSFTDTNASTNKKYFNRCHYFIYSNLDITVLWFNHRITFTKTKMKLEDEVQQLVQIEAAKTGIILMRNNSGALKDITGRLVRYGLGNTSDKINENWKSSDLIAITPIVITPEMVGKTIGVFTAVEMKREGWKYSSEKREVAQLNFIEWVNKKGGIAFFCNGVDNFIKEMKASLNKFY